MAMDCMGHAVCKMCMNSGILEISDIYGHMGREGKMDIATWCALIAESQGCPIVTWIHRVGMDSGIYSYRVCMSNGIPRMSHRPMDSRNRMDCGI